MGERSSKLVSFCLPLLILLWPWLSYIFSLSWFIFLPWNPEANVCQLFRAEASVKYYLSQLTRVKMMTYLSISLSIYDFSRMFLAFSLHFDQAIWDKTSLHNLSQLTSTYIVISSSISWSNPSFSKSFALFYCTHRSSYLICSFISWFCRLYASPNGKQSMRLKTPYNGNLTYLKPDLWNVQITNISSLFWFK